MKLALACVAALALAAGLAACGADDAQELSFTITNDKISGPSSADSGEAEVTLTNDGDSEGELQLIRVEGDHSADEVIKALGGAQQGKPLPDWFFAGGGIGVVQAGEERTATQVMEPGTYYAFNLEGDIPKAEDVPAIEVSGDESDDSVEADATVTAEEYEFKADNLTSGENEIVFENAGDEPHHMLISKIKGDATAKDVESFFKSEKGQPPLEEEGSFDTAVIEGGESQVVDLDLEPGRYAFYCFISDREGGPPHALKGMVSEIDVE